MKSIASLSRRFLFVGCGVWILCSLASFAASADMNPEGTMPIQDLIEKSTPVAVAFMISVLVLKLTAFVLGYLIVRLGHDTMIKGVKGEIDFGFEGSGFKTKLKSATPGAFFVLAGAAIIVWGLTVQKPMDIKFSHPVAKKAESTVSPPKVIPVPN